MQKRFVLPPVSLISIALASALLVTASHVSAQDALPSLRINEVLAANTTVYPDNVDFDDYSDWIELFNGGSQPVSLSGLFLTDDLADPLKWAFPAGGSIPAGGYLVVRADGFNAGPGERHDREYAPWGSFTTDHYHTNFKLSGSGEELALVQADPEAAGGRLPLLTLGSRWKYLDDGSDQGAAWISANFDDSSWAEGPAQFGYGENDEATTISFGNDSENKFATTYFRTQFNVADLSAIQSVLLNLLADDAAIIYINGNETHRVRMADSGVTYQSYALDDAREDTYEEFVVDPSSLVQGTNTVAVEVHQGSGDSSDVSFDLEMIAQTAPRPSEYQIVDSITFGQQWDDISYGRTVEDPTEWSYFGESTPARANTGAPVADPNETAAEVQFSVAGGFRTESVELELSLPEGAVASTIHYSLDGSWPTSSSLLYTGPITLDATTVVRARSFSENLVPGEIETQTYFINEPASVLPVVSFVVDPEVFFDSSIGIYRNVHKGREAPINLAYYEPGGSLAFQVNAGSRIGGENIWRFAQKPLSVTLRGRYGDDAVAYQLFPELRLASFSKFNFRNGGDNWDDDMLRDALTPDLMSGQMQNEVETYRPVVVYMNGEYWGIHNVRKGLDPIYFAAVHHVEPDNYTHLEYGHITSSSVTLGVKEGTVDDYLALENYALSNDLSDPVHWAHMESRMDMESFMDFIIIEDYVNNTSWRHNREFWRDGREGSKWKWIVPDLDRGLNLSNVTTSLLDNMVNDYPLYRELIENQEFLNRMAQRYCAHLGSTFHPQRIADIVDQRNAEVLPEVPRHVAKWSGDGGMTIRGRSNELEEIKEFARQRAPHIYGDYAQNFSMPGTVPLTVNIAAGGKGRILLNGVPVLAEYGETMPVFDGLPCYAIAEPAPGYRFVRWSNGETTERLDFSISSETTLTATFVPSGAIVLPPLIGESRTLAANGIYTADGSVTVPEGVTLTVESGATLRLMPDADIRVAGSLQIAGTEDAPVHIESLRAGQRWGAIAIVDSNSVSNLEHLVVRDGSVGGNPAEERGAISIVRSEVNIDHLDIDDVLIPVFVWYGKVAMRNSTLHTPFTGDCINVKHGEGLVENCTFIGNNAVDTDAIDFDDVIDGIIRDNRIYAFRGPNSDGIDIGEGCVSLRISGNRIYNNSDKGISVGQGSTTIIENNLIVGCVLGIGIKDEGSFARVNQNTFVGNGVAIAVYEKNLGAGGGQVVASNCIFSRSKDAPVTVDSLSKLTVGFSLSDTLPIEGIGNFVRDPEFTDPGKYDFSLTEASPAINAGDPESNLDPDGSRADIGAGYVYNPDDYPFVVPNVIVINEVLSHSAEGSPDWIELHNTSGEPFDISGWFLSDSKSDLRKYRINDETIVPPNGYVVFNEDTSFGETSTDPGRAMAFALSENGETVYLYGPSDNLLLEYLEEESFGPSPTGVSRGRYQKSTNTFNFVFMSEPTPGEANSVPLVGPVVISEIMYHPAGDGDAEYLELLNVSAEEVVLYDEEKNTGWSVTSGVTYEFPTGDPVRIAPGERVLLVRDPAAFAAEFDAPEGTQIFQWTEGGLKNGGEGLELSRPGDVDALGVRQWVRIDRVNYGDDTLWPEAADGQGMSLARVSDRAYGNDVINWIAATPTPGTAAQATGGFGTWASENGLPANASGFLDDADNDGMTNGIEYALGTPPMRVSAPVSPSLVVDENKVAITFTIAVAKDDVVYTLQQSTDLHSDWQDVATTVTQTAAGVAIEGEADGVVALKYFRLRVQQQ